MYFRIVKNRDEERRLVTNNETTTASSDQVLTIKVYNFTFVTLELSVYNRSSLPFTWKESGRYPDQWDKQEGNSGGAANLCDNRLSALPPPLR